MPYNPGVNDISGQLLAQGMMQRARGFSNAIQSYVETTKKRDEENRAALAKGRALENLIKTNAKAFGMDDPDKLKQFLSVDPNERPKDRAARFGEFVENAIVGHKIQAMQQQMETNSLMQDQVKQQMSIQQAEAARKAAEFAQQEKAQLTLGNLGRGVGTGVYRSDIQDNPIVKRAAGIAASGIPVDRQMIQTLIGADSSEQVAGLRNEIATLQRDAKAGKESFDKAHSLRGQFQGLPEVKNYNTVSQYYNRGQQFATGQTAADDISLIFSFMKVLDPTSVVREGEYATAQNSGSIPTTIVNAYNRAMNGEKLTDEQRKQFLSSMEKAARQQFNQLKPYVDQYESLAKKNRLDPEDIVSPSLKNFGPIKIISIKQVP